MEYEIIKCQIQHLNHFTANVPQGRRWYSDQHSGMTSSGPRFDPTRSAGHFSLFDIIAECPKTIQIVAILSSDGTYNVICI